MVYLSVFSFGLVHKSSTIENILQISYKRVFFKKVVEGEKKICIADPFVAEIINLMITFQHRLICPLNIFLEFIVCQAQIIQKGNKIFSKMKKSTLIGNIH